MRTLPFRRIRLLAVMLGTVFAVGAWASTASATIFWTNGDLTNGGTQGFVHKANSDGTAMDPSPFPLTGDAPRGIVSDGTHVYFVDYNTNEILITGTNGSGLTTLVANGPSTPVHHPTGLAIDSSGTLYWANSEDGTIWKLPNAGSATPGPAAQLLAVPGSPAGSLHGLAVDGTYIYWADTATNEIGRASLSNPSGTEVTNFITVNVSSPFGVAIDPSDSHIYWSNQASGEIGKANIDGSLPSIVISPGAGPIRGVAVDGGYVYYAFFSGSGGSIARSPVGGGGAATVVSDSGRYTSGLWASQATVGAPSIGSQPAYTVGTTLIAHPNPSDPPGTTYTRQWYDCDSSGNNCSPNGGTGGTYVIQSSDIGHYIEVSEIGVDPTGAVSTPQFSSPVGPVTSGSGSAVPNLNDQLTAEKAEQFIGLGPGETKSVTVSCPSGYLVLDGSPLVQQIDHGLTSFVQIVQSESTSPASYTFTLRNPTSGNAQAKGFVTCAKSTTTDGGVIAVSAPITASAPVAAGPTSKTLSCPSGTTAVDPGYAFTGGGGRMTASEPTPGLNGWKFTFAEGPANVALSIRCLSNTTSDGDLLQSQELVQTVTVPAGQTVSASISCPVGYKGIVGSYNLPDGVFMLGHEPQPITRVFWLQNNSGSSQSVTLDLLCLSNTTWHLAPPPPPPIAAMHFAGPAAIGNGHVSAEVACGAKMACAGSIKMRSRAKLAATGRFAVKAGHVATVRLKLTRAGKHLVRKGRVRSLKATIAFDGGATSQQTVRVK